MRHDEADQRPPGQAGIHAHEAAKRVRLVKRPIGAVETPGDVEEVGTAAANDGLPDAAQGLAHPRQQQDTDK